jgi:hypothetical protein
MDTSYRDKKVVGVFVRFRAPLQLAIMVYYGVFGSFVQIFCTLNSIVSI